MNHIHRLLILLLLVLCFTTKAQNKVFQFDNFTTEKGLSDDYITCLNQDRDGWLWIGTGLGIERFDGVLFKRYAIENRDGTSVNDFLVRDFFETKDGVLLVGVEELGLARYNREMDRYEKIIFDEIPILSDVSVKSLAEDKHGNIWAATKKGLQKIDFKNQTIQHYVHTPGDESSLSSNYVRKVTIDDQSKIWIGTQKGLDVLDPQLNEIKHYSEFNSNLSDEILSITIDDQHRIWVGTSSYGVLIIDKKEIRNFLPIQVFDRSNKVNSILQDKKGQFWIGTRGGLFSYQEETNRLQHYVNDPLDSKSLTHNSVMCILEDKKGDLWVGTRVGLSYLIKEKQVFKACVARPSDRRFLNSSEVYCILLDGPDDVWIGTESGGVNILNRRTGKFRYLHKDNSKLSSNCIKSIHAHGNDEILIGTFDGGLNIYHKKTGKITSFIHHPKQKGSISSNLVWDICTDKDGSIWIGTGADLDQYDPTHQTFVHFHEFDDMVNGVTWLSVDSVNDLWLGSETTKIFRSGTGIIQTFQEKSRGFFADSKGNNWILTGGKGIGLYDKQKGAIKYYNKTSGLPSNLTYAMLEDDTEKLWISTANGLACFNPENESFKNYFYFDGLQGNKFLYGAACQSDKGEMLFGGVNGLTIFDPTEIIENDFVPPLYLTDFKIYNQSVKISNRKKAILQKSISTAEEIRVPYKYNVLTFEFASLNYTYSAINSYRYILEGFDKTWNETGDSRKANYTNLNPGNYEFKVVAKNKNGSWYKEGAYIRLIVVPPFYMKLWFLMLSALVFLSLLIVVYSYILKRREQLKTIEFEKLKAQKLHELDTFKLKLFTNISHEIKTPLTLIISPLKKILRNKIDDPNLKENLLLIEKNSNQLMKLVTQLLDYRKLQDGKLILELKKGDIVQFCETIFQSFTQVVEDNILRAKFNSVQQSILCYFDAEKLRKILNNLISNAIRYNTPNGEIFCFISMILKEETSYIKIDVIDTGFGIGTKVLPKIFDRYYSKSNSGDFESSGIGLAFAKELIELQKGQLQVVSKEGEGSTFTVLLPFIEEIKTGDGEHPKNEEDTPDYLQSKAFTLAQKSKKILLVVEDNEDVRKFIRSHFAIEFIVLEADNGTNGLDLAIKTIPDIIVSDVMMPGLNGIELCQKIKQDERTSHIPLILLTAHSSNENERDGLEKGADDYISKPFDIDILQTKIENLFKMRKSLIDKYAKQLVLTPKDIPIQTPDEKFLTRTVRLIEDYLDDPGLNVDKFVEQLGISRMQLYRKIDALTNMTVKELVNDIRLKRAEQILSEKKINISDVAYMVGFSDVSYFGKCFKKKFGRSPSELNKNRR